MKSEETQGRSLVSLTLIYTAGNFFTKIFSFLLLFVITFFLTREEVGIYDLVLVTVSLVLPFATLQIPDAVFRWLLDNKSLAQQSKVLSNSFFVIGCSLCLLGIISLFLYFLGISIPYLFETFLIVSSGAILQVIKMFFRGVKQNKNYVFTEIIYSIISVSLSIILLLVGFKIKALLYANILATVITVLFFGWKMKLATLISKKELDRQVLKPLLSYSLPLVPNSISWWGLSSASRYIILFYLGTSMNGIFSISNRLPGILVVIVGVFYMAWQEKAIVSRGDVDRDEKYSYVFEKYVHVLFGLAVLMLGFNKLILSYIVSSSFYEAWLYVPFLLMSVVFNSMAGFFGVGYLNSKKTTGVLTSSLIAGIVAIISSILLIPKIGLYGASIANLLGNLTLLLVRIYHARKFFRIKIPIKLIITYLVLFIVVAILSYGEENYLVFLVPLIAIVGVSVLSYQSGKVVLESVFNQMLKK